MVSWVEGTWLVTVDDAWAYSQCPQSFLNAVDAARGISHAPPRIDQPLRRLMGEVLSAHRARLIRDLSSRTPLLVSIPLPVRDGVGPNQLVASWISSHQATHEALKKSVDAIIQPAFAERDNSPAGVPIMWAGAVDIITRSPRFAPDVDQVEPGWEVWEAKLGATQTGKTLLRLAAITEHCRRWGFDTTSRARIVFANGPDSLRGIQATIDDWVDTKQRLANDLRHHLDSDAPLVWPAEDISSCGRKTCAWCSQALSHHDDIFHLPGVTRAQRHELRMAGFATVTDFAETSRRELSSRISGVTPERRSALHTQATLLTLAARHPDTVPPYEVVTPSALAALPDPSPGDLFIDFEADPTFRQWSAHDPYFPTPATDHPRWWLGVDYLLGCSTWETTAEGDYFEAFWAEDFDQEKDSFCRLLDRVASRRDTDSTAHVYHYAPYEMVALHRMARRYRVGGAQLAAWEKAGVFIDLHRIFTRAIIAGIPNYSLKSVEKLFMPPEARNAISGGEQSVESIRDFWQHRRAGRTQEAAIVKADIVAYNRQDTLSTRDLAVWLAERGATAE